MSTLFNEILVKESFNTASVHLYYFAENDIWKAYGESAARLVDLIPDFKTELHEEQLPGSGIRLMCLNIDLAQEECGMLPEYCILLGDNYIELCLPAASLRRLSS